MEFLRGGSCLNPPPVCAGTAAHLASCNRPATTARLPIAARPALAYTSLYTPPPTHYDETQVDVYTAYFDPARCFAETVGGPFSVTVAGGWFPRAILGRAMALCAYIRCALAALYIAWLGWTQGLCYDVIIADQVWGVRCGGVGGGLD